MSLELVNEVWSAINQYVDNNDRKDAAHDLVTLLIDFNHEPDEIREFLGHDRNISNALKEYGRDQGEETEDEDLDGFDVGNYNDWEE